MASIPDWQLLPGSKFYKMQKQFFLEIVRGFKVESNLRTYVFYCVNNKDSPLPKYELFWNVNCGPYVFQVGNDKQRKSSNSMEYMSFYFLSIINLLLTGVVSFDIGEEITFIIEAVSLQSLKLISSTPSTMRLEICSAISSLS